MHEHHLKCSICKIFNAVALFFIVVGAICWGIWGFFRIDVMPTLFGIDAGTVIYCVIGVFGIYGIWMFIRYLLACSHCNKSSE